MEHMKRIIPIVFFGNVVLTQKAFAHSGEAHETAAEATTHYLTTFLTEPVNAILLTFIIVTIVASILRALKLNVAHITLVVVLLLLIAGILGFIYVPPLGIIGITLGFALTGFLVFSGIKNPDQ